MNIGIMSPERRGNERSKDGWCDLSSVLILLSKLLGIEVQVTLTIRGGEVFQYQYSVRLSYWVLISPQNLNTISHLQCSFLSCAHDFNFNM